MESKRKIRMLVYPEELLETLQAQQENENFTDPKKAELARRIRFVPPESFSFAGLTVPPFLPNWPALALAGILKARNIQEARLFATGWDREKLVPPWPRLLSGSYLSSISMRMEGVIEYEPRKDLLLQSLLDMLEKYCWSHCYPLYYPHRARGPICPQCGSSIVLSKTTFDWKNKRKVFHSRCLNCGKYSQTFSPPRSPHIYWKRITELEEALQLYSSVFEILEPGHPLLQEFEKLHEAIFLAHMCELFPEEQPQD